VLIDSDSCGSLQPNVPVYGTLSGTFTPTTTKRYKLDIQNSRTAQIEDLQNYIDNITLVPQTTDFSSDVTQFSAAAATNTANFTLNAGPSHAGKKYVVLLSASGNWPGITNSGIWVPLNMDAILMFSLQNANSPTLPHSMATLNAAGQATAALKAYSPMPGWLGRTVSVSYVLYNGPGVVPINYASMPVSILFIP
jgi:hypothetical protein